MQCEDVRQQFAEYVIDQIEEPLRSEVTQHLAACTDCSGEAGDMKTLWTALCGALLLFSLVASGSRTAWVSLVVVLAYALIVSANAGARRAGLLHRHLARLLLSGVTLAGV